jgi:uncharacterized protein YciI
MKHFVVEIIYKAPIDKIEEVLEKHREFLDEGYKKGMLLMSGPQVPRIGGIVIARAESMEALAEYFSNDPYLSEGLAHYQYIEFNPVKNDKIISEWIGTK